MNSYLYKYALGDTIAWITINIMHHYYINNRLTCLLLIDNQAWAGVSTAEIEPATGMKQQDASAAVRR